MCDRDPNIFTKILDECLSHFGLKGRNEKLLHDAREDCELTAQVYM